MLRHSVLTLLSGGTPRRCLDTRPNLSQTLVYFLRVGIELTIYHGYSHIRVLLSHDWPQWFYKFIIFQLIWFLFLKENGKVSQNLMGVQIPTVSQSDCRRSYGTLTSRQFCAGVPQGGKDSCQVNKIPNIKFIKWQHYLY